MFKKVLIANRGEIATRIIKTCKRLGVQTVAVFSEADKEALFVKEADEAHCIGPAPVTESYLDSQKIIAVAKKTQADAVHPGYGFLSENAEFAKALDDNDIVFIGPNVDAITLMGSKSNAKACMQKAGVPTTPGYHGKEQDETTLLEKACEIGFPVLLKAAAGGGGKGMRIVEKKDDFLKALQSAKREAIKSFADDMMLIETYLGAPRHIEVQIFADKKGQVVHLFERDCSIQRRHQKIIEEAPATNIPTKIKEKMHQAAIDAARAVDYVGAGTIEFLLEGDAFYFMEMNTRLQVEHPVTEMITGIDLVEWQLRVANDEPLPLSQTEISSCGHAIEVRLYAEDTDNDFLPQTGKINQCLWPTSSKAVRIDTGIEAQNEVSIYYDPMIAKLITHSSSREKAIQLMLSALANTRLTGIKHNRTFLISTLQSKAFQANQINTRFLEDNPPEKPPFDAYPLLAASIYPLLDKSDNTSPWGKKSCWQMNLPPQTQTKLLIEDEQFVLSIKKADESRFQISLNQKDYAVRAQCSNNKLTLEIEGKKHAFYVFDNGVQTDVVSHTTQYRIMRPTHTLSGSETPKGQLSAPMPGNIVAILCHEKDSVTKGQTLMIIEAMKMEHSINAPHDATIKDIFFKIGSQVNEGDELLSLEDRT